ncbi:sugar transferase [Bailinhaonella thermotolerans]|nr:sugar transferase [Bailinhaonella thermotolerans]
MFHSRGQRSISAAVAGATVNPAVRAGPAGVPRDEPRPAVLLRAVPHLLAGSDAVAVAVAAGALGGYGVAAAAVPVLLLLCAARGQYRPGFSPSALDDLPGLAGCGLAALFLGVLAGAPSTPAPALPAAGLAFLVLACGGRTAGYAVLRAGRRREESGRALVVGTSPAGRRIARGLAAHPEYGLRPVGFVADREAPRAGPEDERVLGGLDAAAEVVSAHEVRTMIVPVAGAAGAPGARAMAAARAGQRLGCDVLFVPEPGGPAAALLRVEDHILGFPVARMRRDPRERPSWPVKRVADVAVAALGLVVALPVLAACALAVRRDGGRGVLFRQVRVGARGTCFELLKFRTFTPADEHESATRWSVAGDERVGRVARFLRRTSLDDLPQLWNVLRGDMSVVGPRPERPYFVDRFARAFPHYRSRHRVPVGITGWAQVHGLRGDSSIGDRARFDNHYADTWSLWGDVKILLRTAGAVLRGPRPGGG